MGGFRRFLLFVFGLAGLLCLAALALPWVGPYQQEAASLMDNYYYYLAVQAVLAITVLGVVVMLLRALFTPPKRKVVIVDEMDGDRISVSTAAISSQATHVVEARDRFVVEKVNVSAKKRGKIRVDLRVRPRRTLNVAEEGRALHDELSRGLAAICGDKVSRLNLEFVEAEQPEPAQNVLVERIDSEPAAIGAPSGASAQLQGETGDVTIPLGGATQPTVAKPLVEVEPAAEDTETPMNEAQTEMPADDGEEA